jgi:hypothetical protein
MLKMKLSVCNCVVYLREKREEKNRLLNHFKNDHNHNLRIENELKEKKHKKKKILEGEIKKK